MFTRRTFSTLVLLLTLASVLLLLVPHAGSTPVALFFVWCVPLLLVLLEFTQPRRSMGDVRWHAVSANPDQPSRFQIPPPVLHS